MKSAILTLSFLFLLSILSAQNTEQLTIDEVYGLALQHYPLAMKKDLIRKSNEYSIENAYRGHYPKITLNGHATYQSEVTRIPVELPNMHIEPPAKDQYKIYAEINQSLYHGGRIRNQMHMEEVQGEIEDQQLQVELYKLKDRIHQLYFGILFIDQQLEQIELTKREIQSGIKKTKAAIENGTALRSNLLVLEAELLKIQQRIIEQESSRQSYADMLGHFINKPGDENTRLKWPENKEIEEKITRPELRLFDSRKKSLDVRNKILQSAIQPQVGLFFQGGYGRPALNMLSNDFEPYYIGGIRFSWPLAGFYTNKNERQQLSVGQQKLDVEKETFLFNTNLSLRQQNGEIRKFEDLIEADNKILALRADILASANAQLEHGTITAHDYLSEAIAEGEARQNLIFHQIQLLVAKYNYNTIAGN